MLDFATLLDPATGLVSDAQVVPPVPVRSPFWRVSATLACQHAGRPATEITLAPCTTGACSTTRAQALVRAAGESVERIALHASTSITGTAAEMGSRALAFAAPNINLAAEPGDRVLRWYPARRLTDDTDWLVPAGLVEYPGAVQDRGGFDAGPSGVAAGLSYEAALRSALLETVERDAVIVAWARQQRLIRVDVDAALAAADRDAEWAELANSIAIARSAGLDPIFSRIPLGIPGLVCVIGGVGGVGVHHRLLALGSKVSDHPAVALYAALHESFQLYDALRIFESPDEHPGLVADETDRVRFLASRSGIESLENWFSETVFETFPGAPTTPRGLDALIADLISDGLDPYVVDLTDQLPERVRAHGWTVLKVVPVGYQPLRIDERTQYGWNRDRLRTLESRTGVAARRGADSLYSAPHPLP